MGEAPGQQEIPIPDYTERTVGWANDDAQARGLRLGIVSDAEEGPIEVTPSVDEESLIDKNAEGFEAGNMVDRGSIVGVILVRREPRQGM